MQQPWCLTRGANVSETGIHLAVWAPKCKSLAVDQIDDKGTTQCQHPMTNLGDGVFSLELGWETSLRRYYYNSGEHRFPDPVSRYLPKGVHGPTAIVDSSGFSWSDSNWTGLSLEELIIYELHVGTFTPLGSFAAVVEQLSYLRALGITAIELMPVAQFAGTRNWGYDGVSPYAVQNSYGGPDGLKTLIDAAHRAGIGVILDVVYNHLGPEGNYLNVVGPYFSDAYSTPWGKAINLDGAESDEVRRYFIDNALYWITEYHLDGLRLDACHAIFDRGPLHFLQELDEQVEMQSSILGRKVLLLAEDERNDPRLVRATADGGFGLSGVWNDDFHHVVHSVLTGEKSGYYADFGKLSQLRRVLERRFVYDGTYSVVHQRRRGAVALDVSTEHFIVCIQNHDQVGNRPWGERLFSLVSFEQYKLAAATLLLSPFTPLLFMGEEYGETHPFLYFTSHSDQELANAVRRGRQSECGAMQSIPDPQSEHTFACSVPQLLNAAEQRNIQLLTLYRELISHRRLIFSTIGPACRSVPKVSLLEEWDLLQFTYTDRSAAASFIVLLNFAEAPRTVTCGECEILLDTQHGRFGGNSPAVTTDGHLQCTGYSALLLRCNQSQ